MSLVRIYTASDISPIVSLYGGVGDYEMILRYLNGWYSTPDAKVKLTERSSGDGAHDVAESDIIYSTRTITADYRILADSRSKLLAHERELLSLAHQQVRFRVTDDASDLFVSGYVDSVVKDKSQQNLAKQTETGAITIVCPRPERLAWSPLQTQLFPASVMQGGLRYSTVRQLVSAWTGTPNASASTLSQDGAVVATNLILSPLPRAMDYVTYDATHADSPTLSDQPDGMKLTSNESHNPSAYKNGHTLPAGSYHLHAELSEVSGTKWNDFMLGFFGYITPYPSALSHGIVDYDATLTDDMPSKIFELKCPTDGYAVWRHVGLYTASDWAAMQELGVDWFSGDSYPVPTGKGLKYPLNYGTAGSASNVALLLNQGSSKAFPVLTVTGSFPSGIQIQWGGNALQYDGAIGAVPLILDSRSQTASMGGVDVSRNLSRRDFPVVPAAGSVSLRLMSAGTGWVTAVCRDTYI